MTCDPKYRAVFARWTIRPIKNIGLICSAYKDGVLMSGVIEAYDIGENACPCELLDRIYDRIQLAIKDGYG